MRNAVPGEPKEPETRLLIERDIGICHFRFAKIRASVLPAISNILITSSWMAKYELAVFIKRKLLHIRSCRGFGPLWYVGKVSRTSRGMTPPSHKPRRNSKRAGEHAKRRSPRPTVNSVDAAKQSETS